jgi:DNA-binding NarL/FixJ family response regulator
MRGTGQRGLCPRCTCFAAHSKCEVTQLSVAIHLLIAGRNVMFRQCLAAALERRRRFHAIAHAPDLAVAIIRAQTIEPDVALVQLDSPITPAALDSVRELSKAGCAVLVVSEAQAGEVSHLLQAGARGYLDTTCELNDLERAIDQIHAGDDIIVASSPARGFQQVPDNRQVRDGVALSHASLTERELDVLGLVALGRTNGEIARQLCITEHTAKGHLAKILGKLGLQNRVQLAAYATQRRLTEPVQPPTTERSHRDLRR